MIWHLKCYCPQIIFQCHWMKKTVKILLPCHYKNPILKCLYSFSMPAFDYFHPESVCLTGNIHSRRFCPQSTNRHTPDRHPHFHEWLSSLNQKSVHHKGNRIHNHVLEVRQLLEPYWWNPANQYRLYLVSFPYRKSGNRRFWNFPRLWYTHQNFPKLLFRYFHSSYVKTMFHPGTD